MSGKEGKNARAKAWLKGEMRPYRSSVALLAALTAFGAFLSLSFAYLTRFLVNGAFEKDRRTLMIFAVTLAGIVVLRVVLQTTNNYLTERARAKITVGLRNRLFHRALCADYPAFERYHSGDLVNRLTTDVGEVASDSVSILPAVTGMIIQAVGAFAALLTLDGIFTAIYFAGAVVVVGCSALLRKKLKRYHRETVEADGANRAFMQESFSSVLTLKAYGAEERSARKSERILDGYFRKRMQRNRLRSLTGGAFSLIGSAGLLFAVIWYGVRVMNGTMDYGSILSVVLLLGQIQHPVTAFSSVMPVVYARAASAERLCEIDGLPAEYGTNATKKGRGAELYRSMRALKIERLSFGYEGREEVLDGASAVIGKGETVCLTGSSG
ncbi:MAG: ABC transporter transmembrane domain-containing protein, partial [Candidatus Gallimonas sp.]